MATPNPTDSGATDTGYLDRTFEVARLRERIETREADRSGLMAAIRHTRRGRLDGRFLTDTLRAELARSPDHGVLLEMIEVELRCLRQRLTELERQTRPALRRWQEIDMRLSAGELNASQAVDAAWECELLRRSGPLDPARVVVGIHVCEPARDESLVPGPVLVIDFADGAYGGPRIYRPISDQLRPDTGLFS